MKGNYTLHDDYASFYLCGQYDSTTRKHDIKESHFYHYDYDKIFNIDNGMILHKMLIKRIVIFGNQDCIKFVDVKTNKEFKTIRPRDYDYEKFESVYDKDSFENAIVVCLTKNVCENGQNIQKYSHVEIDYSEVLKCHELI